MDKERYLVFQIVVTSHEIKGDNHDVKVNNILRTVLANNKEEAIGKFVLATKEVPCQKKLEIECYKLNDMIDI